MAISTTSRSALAVLAVVGLSLTACGDDGGDDVSELIDDANEQFDEAMDDLADELNGAIGAGGGGLLVLGGEEIPIASVTCQLGDDTFDVGTVSDNGVRVFVSKTNPANDASVQILDANSVQWFPRDVTGDEAVRDGGTFTAGPYTFFNNQNDETIEAEVTITCP